MRDHNDDDEPIELEGWPETWPDPEPDDLMIDGISVRALSWDDVRAAMGVSNDEI